MSTPAEVLRAYLVSQNHVVMPGVPGETVPFVQQPRDGTTVCFVSSAPDETDQIIAIYDVAGSYFGRPMQGNPVTHPGVKLLVRANDYVPGYSLTQQLCQWIDAIYRQWVAVGSVSYLLQSVYRTSPITPLGEEPSSKRSRFTINARMVFSDEGPLPG